MLSAPPHPLCLPRQRLPRTPEALDPHVVSSPWRSSGWTSGRGETFRLVWVCPSLPLCRDSGQCCRGAAQGSSRCADSTTHSHGAESKKLSRFCHPAPGSSQPTHTTSQTPCFPLGLHCTDAQHVESIQLCPNCSQCCLLSLWSSRSPSPWQFLQFLSPFCLMLGQQSCFLCHKLLAATVPGIHQHSVA